LVVGCSHWGFGDLAGGLGFTRNPNPAILQDNVLSLRLAAFGGLGVVAGLMVQNSLDACRDHVQLGASALELVIFTESPNDLRMVRNGHHKSAIDG